MKLVLLPCRISYLAYIKVFVGLAKDRLNGLMASPSATSAAHIRALALLAWMVTDNATWVMLHFAAFPHSDITYRLLWLFDAVVISVEALQTASIYGMLLCNIIKRAVCLSGCQESLVSVWPCLQSGGPLVLCTVSVSLREAFLCSSFCTFVQRVVSHPCPLLYMPIFCISLHAFCPLDRRCHAIIFVLCLLKLLHVHQL